MKYKYTIYALGKLNNFANSDFAALVEAIRAFYKENNIIFHQPTIEAAIKRQSKILTAPVGVNLAKAAAGARALIKSLMGSAVSPQEMSRRSAICASCPMKSEITGCQSCGMAGKISKFANELRAKKGSQAAIPSEVKTSYCGVCNCGLALMVLTKIEDFYAETPEVNGRRPDMCWLKTTSPNFTNE